MDFIDEMRQIGARIPKQLEYTKTEEATKHALVLPFIHALGYNVFDPTEVVPEFTADVGLKKGEKVDYAILRDGKAIMLFECKAASANLDEAHFGQLLRYFHTSSARIGVLTNGIVYRFFTDLDEKNKMDMKPFLELNLLELRDAAVEEVKRFTKSAFDVDQLLGAATELKYTKEIKRILADQLVQPAEEIVRFFVSQVYGGVKSRRTMEQFTDITRRALNQFVTDAINERLKQALGDTGVAVVQQPAPAQSAPAESISGKDDGGVVTTPEEIEAYHIVKAILRDEVEPRRIVMRDTASYCGVLLDDNNRKPLARFRFSETKKVFVLITEKKEEERIAIGDLNDIYQHASRLKATVGYYAK